MREVPERHSSVPRRVGRMPYVLAPVGSDEERVVLLRNRAVGEVCWLHRAPHFEAPEQVSSYVREDIVGEADLVGLIDV